MQRYELLIVGGGPAGLSAALVSGRARRRVLLVEGGTPRNAGASAVHSFVTRDGVSPSEFRRSARDELAAYPTVSTADDTVVAITGEADAFQVRLKTGREVTAKRVLLAVGLVDSLPDIPGVREFWGRGVHHCAYCDGFEHQDQPWGILADQPAMLDYALLLSGWTRNITLFTNGDVVLAEEAADLQKVGFRVVVDRIARVIGGQSDSLEAVELADGRRAAVESFWIRPAQRQTDLVTHLGLALAGDGSTLRSQQGETSRPGIFAAGDLSAGAAQQAILAAADGARVTFGICHHLVLEALAEANPSAPIGD